MRRPTVKQADRLWALGNGSIVLTPRRADWAPLLRNGWVERADQHITPRGGLLPPLRITADGLRVLAAAVERDGLPDLNPKAQTRPRRVCADCGGSSYRFESTTAEEALANG